MKRRTFLRAVAAAPILGSAGAAEPEIRVAVNRTTIESAPLLVQAIPGVRVVLVPSGRVASAQLVSGRVDVATGSETQALLNSVAQPELRIVLTLAECRYRMVARASAGIRSVADLRGKRVATTANTSAQYFLAEMLRTAHLQEQDVNVVFLEGMVMPGALARREVDAIAIWEPHAQNGLEVLGGDGRVFEDSSIYRERFNLNTTAALLRDPVKRNLLVKLVREVRRTSARLETSPGEFLPRLSAATGTPERVIGEVWKQFRFPAALDALQLRSVLQSMEPWAAAIAGRKPRSAEMLERLVDISVWQQSLR